MQLKRKKVIIIGERDGVQGPAIEVPCPWGSAVRAVLPHLSETLN
jgi:hypothetical protein